MNKEGVKRAQALMVRRSLTERFLDSPLFWVVSVLLVAANVYLIARPIHWG